MPLVPSAATYGLTRNLTSNLTGNLAGGAAIGSEARAYTYDAAGRLLDETFGTTSGNSSGNIAYGFDANKLGVRVSASTSGSPSSLAGNWAIPTSGLNGFAQATLEQQDPRFLTANGTVNGPVLWMSATVDGNALPGLAYYTANATTGQVNWSTPMTAGLGNHTLTVNAGHPSGAFTATGTSNFTVATAQNVTNTHDGGGFVTQRSWSSGPTDNLTWDAAGRLLQVSRRDVDNDGFNEQSIYDPLGRRVRTVYTPYNNSTAATTYANTSWNTPAAPGQSETTDSWFDPQVEFLEIATVQTSGNATSGVQWKVYGPDESGAYGGVQGVGGLEAVIGIGNASATPIVPNTISAVWSDMLGHVEAYSLPANITGGSATPGTVTPQSRSSGYGLLPSEAAVARWSQSAATGTTTSLAASLAWQGRRMDASGYYSIGAREYNPTAGRFLSPDPLGQAKSWDLYSYAGGDPINYIDCTGRSLVQATQNQSLQPSSPGGLILNTVNTFSGSQTINDEMDQTPGPSDPVTDFIFNAVATPVRIGADAVSDLGTAVKDASHGYYGLAAADTFLGADELLTVGATLLEPEDAAPETILETAAEDAVEDEGSGVLFGQRRIDPTFSTKPGVPDYLAGRPISDVAADLQAGILSPDQLPINAFQNEAGQIITLNNRTLAALSEAGMQPTVINMVTPTTNELGRLLETPIIDSPIPGRLIPVTPSQSDLSILRIISTPQ